MYERFVDREDKSDLISKCPDFKMRRHGVPPVQVVYAFLAAMLAVVMLVGHLTIKLLFLPDNAVTPVNEISSILFAISFCIGAVSIFSIALIYKIRDLILETEFQNLIFASASRINTDFCIIINKDKDALYCDYNFSLIFPGFENQTKAFIDLLAHEGFKKADRDKVLKGIANDKSVKVAFVHNKSSDGKPKKYEITVDPLSRPSGYYAVRGAAV